MYSLNFASLAVAALTLSPALSNPIPEPEMATCAGGSGSHGYEYTVDSTTNVPGDAQVGDYSVSGATGNGQLTAQTSYSVGVTVELGVELGLDFESITSAAGISGSVSTTTEKGSTQGVTDTCPQGDWYCALSITPTMVQVNGKATPHVACGIQGDPTPYTITFPKLGSDGNPITNAEACTCQNLKDWADPGHIGLLCPGDCALPSGS